MPNYLEVDSKILEKNLLLKNDSTDADNFENFLRSPQNYVQDNAAWKLATPTAGLLILGFLCLLFRYCCQMPTLAILQNPVFQMIFFNLPSSDFLDLTEPEYILLTDATQGFCVKTTDSRNKKVFVNICKLDDIPEPRDISEAELLELWQSDSVPDYRIPLSIQEPHDEFDKSGNPTIAYDVALNTKFFQKIQSNMVFRSFVMQVVLEGIENKYDVELKKEGYVILQNRKSLGELKAHRIRKSKLAGGSYKPLIEELDSTNTPSGSGDSAKGCRKTPGIRLYENTKDNFVTGEFHFPVLGLDGLLVITSKASSVWLTEPREGPNKISLYKSFKITNKIFERNLIRSWPNKLWTINGFKADMQEAIEIAANDTVQVSRVTPEELTLNVNENRIVIDHPRSSYFADFFIPVKIDETHTTASYNSTTNILTVKMPLISPGV